MNDYTWNIDYISHHGILNQKWGVRHGPPYPLKGGSYSKAEKQAILEKRKKRNSIYNKQHFDEVLKAEETTLSTLSHNPDRLKDAKFFYATHNNRDKNFYISRFNGLMLNENHKPVHKWKIDSKIASDMKIASEDSGVEAFSKLYEENRDFYNFVKDPNRMRSYIYSGMYKKKEYGEAKEVLDKMDDSTYKPTSEDIHTIYRLFNYVIPADGRGNQRIGKDVETQREKFFDELKKNGYGAVLDTNDAIYGNFKAKSPIIVFDVTKIIPDKIARTSVWDVEFADIKTDFNLLLEKVV